MAVVTTVTLGPARSQAEAKSTPCLDKQNTVIKSKILRIIITPMHDPGYRMCKGETFSFINNV